MSSSDWLQLSTLLNRLHQITDPIAMIEALYDLVSEAVDAVSDEPKGDPDELERLATAFDTAGTAASSIGTKVRAHATDKLPHAWTGYAGSAASDAVIAVADDIDMTPTAFTEAASALRTLAGQLREAKTKHDNGRKKLGQAGDEIWWHLPFGIKVPDPTGVWSAVHDAVAGLVDCIQGYEQAQHADQQAASRFRDVQGDARVSYVQTGARVSDVDAAIMADQLTGSGSWDRGVLSDAQLARASQLLNSMPPAQAAAVLKLLRGAGNDTERAYLLKGLGAGYTPQQLAAFDKVIHGHDADWLNEHLNVGMANGDSASVDGVPVVQKDETTCGSTSILMTRLMADPLYALYLTTGIDPTGARPQSNQTVEQRLAAEEQHIHDLSTQGKLGPLNYPQGLGTPPWGATDVLNSYSKATGVNYGYHLVDDTDGSQVDAALASVERSVDSGKPAVIYTGDGVPRHIMVVVGHVGDQLQIYEPGGGQVLTVSEDDFRNGHMNGAGGWPHVDFVITPSDN